MKASKLSCFQRAFVDEYMKTPEDPIGALKRMIDAGVMKRCKEEKLKKEAQRLLDHPKVQHTIAERMAAKAALGKWDEDQIESRLSAIAGADLGDFMSWSNTGVSIIDSKTLEKAVRMNVAEVTCSPGQWGNKWKIKLHNPTAALESLARIHSMFKDNLKITLEDELEAMTDEELREQIRQALAEDPSLISQFITAAAHQAPPGPAGKTKKPK